MAEIKKNVVDLGALGSIALVDYSGSDLSAVNAARCSYGTYKEELDEKDVKLIKYLVKHDHGTPFEHNFMSFRVRCPKPINVQWIRHRSGWSYNEISGRYVEFKDDFYIPEKFRKQHETSKQASVSHDWCELKEAELKKIYTDSLNQSYIAYTKLIEEGVAKEQARMLMPFGFITEFYASCNLRSFMHWYKLRSDEHAQYEIRQFAEAAMSLIKDKYPVTVKAMLDKESGK